MLRSLMFTHKTFIESYGRIYLYMTILYLLGLLAFCYLLLGPAGFLGFWIIIRYPLALLLALAFLIDIPIFGINPAIPAVIFGGLAFVDVDKVPDWVWDLINLIIYVAFALGMFYIFILVFGDPF